MAGIADKVIDGMERAVGAPAGESYVVPAGDMVVIPNVFDKAEDGKPRKSDAFYQRHGSTIAAGKVKSAVEGLKRVGIDAPDDLANLLVNYESLSKRTIAAPPVAPDPSLPATTFDRDTATYLDAYAQWSAERDARNALLRTVQEAIVPAAYRSLDAVLPALAETFNDTARKYTESAQRLDGAGIHSITDAATADPSGELVAEFHRRATAEQRLDDLLQAVKPLLGDPLVVDSIKTAKLVVTGAINHAEIVNQKPAHGGSLFRSALAHGGELRMVTSRAEWVARSGEVVSDDSDGDE